MYVTTYEPWMIENHFCLCGKSFCLKCEMKMFKHGYVHNAWWQYDKCPLCILNKKNEEKVQGPQLSIEYIRESRVCIPEQSIQLSAREFLQQEKQAYENFRKIHIFKIKV